MSAYWIIDCPSKNQYINKIRQHVKGYEFVLNMLMTIHNRFTQIKDSSFCEFIDITRAKFWFVFYIVTIATLTWPQDKGKCKLQGNILWPFHSDWHVLPFEIGWWPTKSVREKTASSPTFFKPQPKLSLDALICYPILIVLPLVNHDILI